MDTDSLEKIASALLRSYDLDQAERPRLPARQVVVETLDKIRRILFPGYYAEERLPPESRAYYVGTWLSELETCLAHLIGKSMAHAGPKSDLADRSGAVALGFLRQLPLLREQLRFDAEAALAGDPAANSVEEVILTYPGFEAITVHRIAHWLWKQDVPFLPRIMAEHAHTQTGIDIHPGAQIGESFFIDHGTGVVIGETTNIGNWVKIYQGVTLGALSVERSQAGTKRHPTLEDGVVIYAGATVLGGKTVIGRDAVIGGNVWLTGSVEPGTTVLESPPDLDFRSGNLSNSRSEDAG
ncbi:MAG: serine acetyltransferase [Myxococcales bacterium]|nr:serine acetyltransferase [Myxococcales bacterium]